MPFKDPAKKAEYQRAYYIKHKEELDAYAANYYLEHREKQLERQKTYSANHRGENKEYWKQYNIDHRAIRSEQSRKRNNKRRQTDIQFKLSANLRTRIYDALKGGFKSGSAVKDLGCSIAQFCLYLENQFEPGMSWDNYGKWHLDHVQPLSSFDLTDRSQFIAACNWLNYQPLWAIDNLSKGAAT